MPFYEKYKDVYHCVIGSNDEDSVAKWLAQNSVQTDTGIQKEKKRLTHRDDLCYSKKR